MTPDTTTPAQSPTPMTKEIILCKYGELLLKGANKKFFEDALLREVRIRARNYGNFDVYRAQSTIYIDPQDDNADIDGMFRSARTVFGFVSIGRSAVCEKDMDAIRALARAYLPPQLADKHTFKVEARRSDKTFPLNSMEIAAEIGATLLDACPHLRVDVHHPDITVRVEIREYGAYLHAGQLRGAGGMPAGTSGKGMLLLSGGIDSPVAGYMMAKRGLKLQAVYFESPPYTSEQARQKVLTLAQKVALYAGPIDVHVVSLTDVQEKLTRTCEEEYFTLLLRRYMMAIADRLAERHGCHALITGESLGQVASQTLLALGVTDPLATRPVFRPCIGMDKEEIVKIAYAIDTFETSILPYEDCCTVFTPRHPKTKPELARVQAEERKLDFETLVNEALATAQTYHVSARY